MRPSSVASSRASQAPGSQSAPAPPSAALLARLADKKKEFEAVDALQRASALFLRRLEGLADDCEQMAEAGIGAFTIAYIRVCACLTWHSILFFGSSSLNRLWGSERCCLTRMRLCWVFFCFVFLGGNVAVHGQVLAQWPQMFRILNMFGTGVHLIPSCV